MCGRYLLSQSAGLAERFGIDLDNFDDGWSEKRPRLPNPIIQPPLMPRFNVAPSQLVTAVLEMPEGRTLVAMRWGFTPSWFKDGKRPPPINARSETIAELPMFKASLRHYRCILPADGFYEWQKVDGRKSKQPHAIRLKGGELFGFAGIWTLDAEDTPTCAIVTTTPNELMEPTHNRMPVILDPDDEALWLDPEADAAAALACLRPYPAEALEAYPVGTEVGNVRNDGPELVEPLEPRE